MKKITIILLGFIALLAVSCDKDDHLAPDKSKYVYDIPQRRSRYGPTYG